MAVQEKLRLDKYLWAIRLFKTRSLSARACETGKVKFNGASAKASRQVQPGDEYEVKTESRKWRIRITSLLQSRVKHELAINFYIDITPADANPQLPYQPSSFHTGKRRSRIGRPTKKERRDMGDFMQE